MITYVPINQSIVCHIPRSKLERFKTKNAALEYLKSAYDDTLELLADAEEDIVILEKIGEDLREAILKLDDTNA